MKYYVVSDIHGYYDELIYSLKENNFFDDKEDHKLLILGDIFDRGKQAKELEKFITDLIKKDKIIIVRGNHEDLMLEFINNINLYKDRIEESHHFRNSTVDTICQLLDVDLEYLRNNPSEIVKRFKETDTYKIILKSLINYYETKNYVFVHGFIPAIAYTYGRDGKFIYKPNWRKNTTDKEWFYARWYNGIKANSIGLKEYNKTIICGHWHSSYGHHYIENDGDEFGDNANYNPYYGDDFICIDGCVPRSHKINLLIIEDDDLKEIENIINEAVDALYNDELVILPTETVFGVAGKVSDIASEKIYQLKNRPSNKQLPIAVNSIKMIESLVSLNDYQYKVLTKLLPGPITFILKLTNKINGYETAAFRYSDNKILNTIIARLNAPLFLTSANISGQDPINNAFEAKNLFKDKVKVYIDGKVNYNLSSTIVDLTNNNIKILREGPISLKEIEEKIGD